MPHTTVRAEMTASSATDNRLSPTPADPPLTPAFTRPCLRPRPS